MGTRILIAVLIAFLAWGLYIGYAGWTSGSDVGLPTSAYVALFVGIFFTAVVGCGLMALVFYSSRRGYDEPARRD